MFNDVFINIRDQGYLQNKVIELEKKIKEYEQKTLKMKKMIMKSNANH